MITGEHSPSPPTTEQTHSFDSPIPVPRGTQDSPLALDDAAVLLELQPGKVPDFHGAAPRLRACFPSPGRLPLSCREGLSRGWRAGALLAGLLRIRGSVAQPLGRVSQTEGLDLHGGGPPGSLVERSDAQVDDAGDVADAAVQDPDFRR